MSFESEKSNVFKSPVFIFSIIIFVFAGYLTIILINIWPIDSKTIGQAGVFGDSFGVLTALFSALAFGGLMITIWQQQEELRLNRDEIRTQHFENILFRMLEVHTEIVRDLDIMNGKGQLISSGRDCFPYWAKTMKENYSWAPDNDTSEKEKVFNMYKYFWDKWNKDLGHYFRFLYNVFKHIDTSSEKDKKKYSNIVRAQLSDYELLLLFYNCLYVHGSLKFKPLVEKYSLMDNLPVEMLIKEEHKKMYNNEAFGEF